MNERAGMNGMREEAEKGNGKEYFEKRNTILLPTLYFLLY